MSDPSQGEHLAPVSYLPWAVPGQPIHDADDGTDGIGTDGMGTEAIEDDTLLDDSLLDEASRAQQRHPAGRRMARRSGDRPRLAVVGDPETGAERDERIDRLVVSRLRRSSLSVSEVRDVLVEHGLDDVEVDEWIERYVRLGYLDDARLAEHLVHVQTSRRGRGSGAILSELTRRGIDPVVARDAVDGLDPDTEREQALEVAERRYRQLRGLDRSVAERRLSAFLQRRGYSGDVVRAALAQVMTPDRS